MPEPSLFEPFIVRLERLGIPYFVTGSTAGIRYGEPRLTHDVDIVISTPTSEGGWTCAPQPITRVVP